jgi:hypothetical protein
MPIPGLKAAAYLAANVNQQSGLPTLSVGFNQRASVVDSSPMPMRDPHPFISAPPLPPPESVEPATRLAFEIADLQVDRLTAASDSHIRRSEFHNAVDQYGNTFNANDHGVHFSVPLVLTSLCVILLASSIGLAFFTRVRPPSPALVPSRQDQPESLADSPSQSMVEPLPAIEWEQVSPPSPSHTWAALLEFCGGDVMAAAALITRESVADPRLDPASSEAFRRAIEAAHMKTPEAS